MYSKETVVNNTVPNTENLLGRVDIRVLSLQKNLKMPRGGNYAN